MNNTQIDQITKKVAQSVTGAQDYGIMTACFINGEFVCVTDYSITPEMFDQLEAAARIVQEVRNCDDNSMTSFVGVDNDGLATFRNTKGFGF